MGAASPSTAKKSKKSNHYSFSSLTGNDAGWRSAVGANDVRNAWRGNALEILCGMGTMSGDEREVQVL
jgi:hypothetical protein